MSLTYDIDSDAGVMTVEIEGQTAHDDLMTTLRAWLNDPDFRPGLRTLCVTDGALSMPTLPELIEIVDLMKEYTKLIERRKVAIVSSRPMAFAVARQFGALAPGGLFTVQVFRDRESAMEWLADAPASR